MWLEGRRKHQRKGPKRRRRGGRRSRRGSRSQVDMQEGAEGEGKVVAKEEESEDVEGSI